jgi:putative copper export protein/mono/diheme cytochrome c family protein/peroxiredoxin
MTTLLFAVQWGHLALCVLVTGAFFVLLLAGPPQTPFMLQWELRVLRWTRWLVVGALISGAVVAATWTALFEGRAAAALEPQAIWRAVLETRPGFLWVARHGLLLVLAAFLFLGAEAPDRKNWIAARGQAFLLAASALALIGRSSHVAAISEGPWTQGVAMSHLLAAGVWLGGLPALALLLENASREAPAENPHAFRTMRRYSRVVLVMAILVAGSGVASAWRLIGGVAGLAGTTHGCLLLAKLAVLVPMLLLAAATHALLPKLSSPSPAIAAQAARRMALFTAVEAGLGLALLGFAAAMTVATPAVHEDPVWPWRIRLALDSWLNIVLSARFTQFTLASVLAVSGLAILAVTFLVRRQTLLLLGTLFALLAVGAAIVLQPSMVQAYPTSFVRSPAPYTAESIAEGMAIYQAYCASCHGTPNFDRGTRRTSAVDLLATESAWLSSGDLFWLITHGAADPRMPAFGTQLQAAQRWRVINFLRALANAGFCASLTSQVGSEVEPDNAWLPAPDLTISVGPLTPTALRDFRGKRMVLLVLYSLPESRARMSELAKRYGALSVLGVEVVAVPPRSSPAAIAELGQTPPVLFPVVTDGNEAITAAFRMYAPGVAHAELLIDRQGYIRAIWRSDQTGMPDADLIQAQVEKLNEEKAPPPAPDDHVH